eukprot:15099824-Alexandrium_andersonii.AAC.1
MRSPRNLRPGEVQTFRRIRRGRLRTRQRSTSFAARPSRSTTWPRASSAPRMPPFGVVSPSC